MHCVPDLHFSQGKFECQLSEELGHRKRVYLVFATQSDNLFRQTNGHFSAEKTLFEIMPKKCTLSFFLSKARSQNSTKFQIYISWGEYSTCYNLQYLSPKRLSPCLLLTTLTTKDSKTLHMSTLLLFWSVHLRSP